MYRKLRKLSLQARILCIGVAFFIWIKLGSFINVKGELALVLSTIVLAIITFVFLILIPENLEKPNNKK